MCGKYILFILFRKESVGSPPHVREVRGSDTTTMQGHRITPACAGSTDCALQRKPQYQDHPRMCGKYDLTETAKIQQPGSPPHVREVLSINSSIN